MAYETEFKTLVGKEFANEAIKLISTAANSIKIIVFDWRWYPTEISSPVQQFNNAIIAARKRGIEVKAITNYDHITAILKKEGIIAKKLYTEKLMHVKLMIVDDRHIIIGSHNYTQNAFSLNLEVSILIKDYPDINRLLDFFNRLI